MKDLKIELGSAAIAKYMEHVIANNRVIADLGKTPLAVEIQGNPGLGKTQLCKQIAKKAGMRFVKLNLAQMSDNGDMLGSPIRTQLLSKDGVDKWIANNLVSEYISRGWVESGAEPRTEYCKPKWIIGDEPILLLLDDWTRANPDFLQAVMELIESQTFTSWALPKYSTVMLTSNPAGGDMQVNEIDDAMRTRFASVTIRWNIDSWVEWAETANIDPRCINFLQKNHDAIFNAKTDKGEKSDRFRLVNPRVLTKFFDSIYSIKGDYNVEPNKSIVTMCGRTSIGQELTSLFLNAVKLDDIPSPEEFYSLSDDKIVAALEKCCNGVNGFKNDVATMLSRRIINYSKVRIDEKKWKAKDVDRLIMLCNNSKIFKEDQAFFIVKNLTLDPKYGKNFQAMYRDPYLNKALIA